VSGWMTQLDAYWGEDWVIDTHETMACVLQACILIHWAGVLLMSRLQKENLVSGILTGRKTP
jgi:cytochrome b